MTRIRNVESLARTPARRDVCAIVEAGYRAIETDHVVRASVHVHGDVLTIQAQHTMEHGEPVTYDLRMYEKVYIVGCGKVACSAAIALESILKERVTDGAVIGLTKNVCEIVATYEGSHPLPSEANFSASSHIEKIGTLVTEKDLVLVIVGGGGSAMLCSTQGECDQGQRLYNAFLGTGGTIDELNIVRKHISPLKGGGLAKLLYPATVVGLVFSDVPGGDPKTVASGITYKDSTTIADAETIIAKYNLGHYELTETPKEDKYFERVTNILLVSNETAIHAMAHKARSLGYEALLPQCDPYAPCTELVQCMTGAARPKSVMCVGGEPRLVVPPDSRGVGGRCSFTALVALETINTYQVFAAYASDGHDNSKYAGAIVDESTRTHTDAAQMNRASYRDAHNSNTLFEKTFDLIDTGSIDANVSDLFVLLTP